MKQFAFLLILSIFLTSCFSSKKEASTNELWIYTSLYKDTIAELKPQLEKDFPGVTFKWYQAGSENIATKVNGELMSSKIQADVLISSDRFWYEDMANKGRLIAYKHEKTQSIPNELRHPKNYYSTLSIPVMVLSYNSDIIKPENAPKTYKEMSEPKWQNKFTTGSPLASGTNFTTMAMLQYHYGWDYFKNLKKNNTIAQGGNSGVIRRIQSGERPVGWVLLENLLRLKIKKGNNTIDERLKIVYPSDGVVTHANVIAITKKGEDKRELAKKFVEWMYSDKGQTAMTNSYMYSPIPSFKAPMGAPPFETLLKNSFKWTNEFIQKITSSREQMKEKYTEIMFQ